MRIEAICRMPMIMEAVLYAPIETVLAPYVEQAPSEEAKKWLLANFKNWLLKSTGDLYQLPYLPRNATEQQKKAFSFKDLYDIRLSPRTQTMLEHILDFFKNYPNPPRLERMSVDNVVQAADDAVSRYNAAQAKQARQVEDNPGVTTLMEFPGGYRFVELSNQKALDREGSLMGHCVGSLHGCYIKDKSRRIFSLRDADNEPHVTIEVTSHDMETTEIKGRSNDTPVRRYWPMIHDFIAKYGIKVDNDYRNIGLLNIFNPETNQSMHISLNQFRDMILDPDNSLGQTLLTSYQDDPHRFGGHRGSVDLSMGMFTALYGTDQLRDDTIDLVFRSVTENAIQVVQQYGNRLTPEQQVVAFTAIPDYRGEIIPHYKGLLAATKPDAELANKIIEELNASHERGERSSRDASFVTALSQTLPETYKSIISDPAALERELKAHNERAAGPFFVFVGTPALKPEMVTHAFSYFPEEALKRLKQANVTLDHEALRDAITALLDRYWSREETAAPFFDKFVAYTKPDRDILRFAFDGGKSESLTYLLIAARNHVPDQLDKETVEKAVLAIDDDDVYKTYLASEADPSLQIQQRLLEKDKEDIRVRDRGSRLHYLQQIDPSIYKGVLEFLRPVAIPTDKEDYRNTYKNGNIAKQHKFRRPLNAEERTSEIDRERQRAISRFLRLLQPALIEPTAKDIDPNSKKFQAGKAAFEAMGKGKLFDVAIGRLTHQKTVASVTNDVHAFQQHLLHDPSLTAKEIVAIITNYQTRAKFADVVNFAPQRVPEILVTERGPYHRNDVPIYGKKLEGDLDKEKTFASLEAVWASTRVPEGVKDQYTLAVFKRFKPVPAQLLDMLEKADNEDAVIYVLKKTKKPSRDLVQYVFDGFPQLLPEIAIDAIPDDILAKMFTEQPKQALALMNRDLRAYGKDDPRRKYDRMKFRSMIDPNSPVYARYQKAAEAAGKAALFARYVRQAELEDTHHDKLVGRDDKPNMALLTQHLDEYSARTLLHVAHHDDSAEVYKLYFKHFDDKKLAGLISAGLFPHVYFNNYGYGSRGPEEKLIPQIDKKKLRDSFILALARGKKGDGTSNLVTRMIKGKFKFDDELIIAILKAGVVDGEERKALLAKVGDPVKDWVADNMPIEMDEIKEPNEHMIQVLFDKYATLSRGKHDKKVTVNYWFEQAVKAWFGMGGYSDHHFKANPRVAKMLTDEAKKRKGLAVTVVTNTFRHMNALRQKTGDKYGHAQVVMPPRGTTYEKD